MFGVSAIEQREAQRWYITRASEVHQWPQDLQEMQWSGSDDEVGLGPFDEHQFHSSADEAECSQRGPDEEENIDEELHWIAGIFAADGAPEAEAVFEKTFELVWGMIHRTSKTIPK